MRLQQYLTETSGSRLMELGDDDVKLILSTKCKQSVKRFLGNGIRSGYIWRGIQNKKVTNYQGFGKGDRPRKSRNTENYYTLFMDNHPLWSKFPKRSESFVCSTEVNKADGYGSNFAVFPVDGSKIGVCGGRDLWDSFSKLKSESLQDLSTMIYFMLNTAKSKGLNVSDQDDDWKQLKKHFGIIEKWLEDGEGVETYVKYFDERYEMFHRYFDGSIIRMMGDIITPDGFLLKKSGDILPDNNEVWTDGQCVFVHRDTLTKEWASEMESMV